MYLIFHSNYFEREDYLEKMVPVLDSIYDDHSGARTKETKILTELTNSILLFFYDSYMQTVYESHDGEHVPTKDEEKLEGYIANFLWNIMTSLCWCVNWKDFEDSLEKATGRDAELMYSNMIGKSRTVKQISISNSIQIRFCLDYYVHVIGDIVNTTIDRQKNWSPETLSENALILSNNQFSRILSSKLKDKKYIQDKLAFLSQLYRTMKSSGTHDSFFYFTHFGRTMLIPRERNLIELIDNFVWELTPSIYFESASQTKLLKAKLNALKNFNENRFDRLIKERSSIKKGLRNPKKDVGEYQNNASAAEVIRTIHKDIMTFGPDNENVRFWILYLFMWRIRRS